MQLRTPEEQFVVIYSAPMVLKAYIRKILLLVIDQQDDQKRAGYVTLWVRSDLSGADPVDHWFDTNHPTEAGVSYDRGQLSKYLSAGYKEMSYQEIISILDRMKPDSEGEKKLREKIRQEVIRG